jgi:hypothetical protein
MVGKREEQRTMANADTANAGTARMLAYVRKGRPVMDFDTARIDAALAEVCERVSAAFGRGDRGMAVRWLEILGELHAASKLGAALL